MSRGWIPAHRKMYEPDHWLAPTGHDPSNRRDAWCWILAMTTHKPRQTRRSGTLERGEFVASVRTMAKHWKWSKSRVFRFISELEASTAIETVRGTPDGTVYRVVNYDTYAVDGDSERDTERDTERDRSGTEAGQEQSLEHKNRTTEGGSSARSSRLPKAWSPTASHIERAKDVGLDLVAEVEKFRAHAEENERTAKNWNGAFTRWLINAEEYARRDGRLNGKGEHWASKL